MDTRRRPKHGPRHGRFKRRDSRPHHYNAFGQPVSHTALDPAAVDVAFGYDGLFTDATTGDDFAVNRVYDPSSGTWNTPDPAQADVNTYRAFGNSPTNEVDPEGLEPYANAPSREERFNAEWERIGREYLSILTPGEFGEQQAKELTDYINQSLDFEAKFTTWFNSLPPAERYSTDPSPSVLSP